MTPFRIIDLTPDDGELIEQAALLLLDGFRNRGAGWQDLESARQEVVESLAPDRISRVLLNESGIALGWIGGIPMYTGRVWEIHPLVVSGSHRRRGIGRALVEDLQQLVERRGALTLWAGSDDENKETTLSDKDLYPDIPGAIQSIRNLRHHPYEFYLRLGFRIAGVLPDANGRGKPDIFLAKRVGAMSKKRKGGAGKMAKKSRGGRMTAAKKRAAKKPGGKGRVKKRKAGRNIMKT